MPGIRAKKSKTGASQLVLVVKNLPANAGNTGDSGSIPGWRRSPGGGNGNPLQYSCWENPMDRGAWWATVHEVSKNQTWLSDWAHSTHAKIKDNIIHCEGYGQWDVNTIKVTYQDRFERAVKLLNVFTALSPRNSTSSCIYSGEISPRMHRRFTRRLYYSMAWNTNKLEPLSIDPRYKKNSFKKEGDLAAPKWRISKMRALGKRTSCKKTSVTWQC